MKKNSENMENMENILTNLLNLSAENEIVEFKEAKNQFDKDKLGQYFSAISNEANLKEIDQGWLVLGVKNDKTIVGTSITEQQLNEYKNELGTHTNPKMSFAETARIKKNGETVILCEIPAALRSQPVSWKGHCYGRNGESLSALNDYKRDKIKSQCDIDWSSQIIKDATINDLSEEAIAFARKQYVERNSGIEKDILSWDDETFLNKAKITIKAKITNTAILLLGKSESEHFINPAQAKISWILKDKGNAEKDHEHFSCPFILSVNSVKQKIRNLKYRYITNDTVFPDEVEQYDPFIIRESLNNCIAHQDYKLKGKINVVEYEDGSLLFKNVGSFIPKSIENVISANAPETIYRNPFLTTAMVNLNMIETIGSGIRNMFKIQKNKFFPLPSYDFAENNVEVTIYGKMLNLNYAKKLYQMPELELSKILLLDKVAKGKIITDAEVKILRNENLIEGRKPNYHISAVIAKNTGEQVTYLKQRGIDDNYCQKMILEYLVKFGKGKRLDFEKLLLNKLPEILNSGQKKTKIKNNLQTLRRKEAIETDGRIWKIR